MLVECLAHFIHNWGLLAIMSFKEFYSIAPFVWNTWEVEEMSVEVNRSEPSDSRFLSPVQLLSLKVLMQIGSNWVFLGEILYCGFKLLSSIQVILEFLDRRLYVTETFMMPSHEGSHSLMYFALHFEDGWAIYLCISGFSNCYEARGVSCPHFFKKKRRDFLKFSPALLNSRGFWFKEIIGRWRTIAFGNSSGHMILATPLSSHSLMFASSSILFIHVNLLPACPRLINHFYW